jgi:hypothetical protein
MYDYRIYVFKLSEVQEAEDWLNERSVLGYKIVDTHYYEYDGAPYVRYTMERNRN